MYTIIAVTSKDLSDTGANADSESDSEESKILCVFSNCLLLVQVKKKFLAPQLIKKSVLKERKRKLIICNQLMIRYMHNDKHALCVYMYRGNRNIQH